MMPRFSIDMNALTGKIRMNNPMEKSKCFCPVVEGGRRGRGEAFFGRERLGAGVSFDFAICP